MSRFATRWASGDPSRARTALLVLLCLRGTPVLYQGDEIGLGDVPVAPEDLRDPLGVRYWPAYAGRDAMRTPMPWREGPGGGFTAPDVQPWLPLGEPGIRSVESQRADPASMLHLARDLIALRRATPDLRDGPYQSLPSPEGVWAWKRGHAHVVVANLCEEPVTISSLTGRVRLGTDRGRDGQVLEGTLSLGPFEGVVAAAGNREP